MPYLWARIDGLVGRMDIPDLGAHIGDFVTATLTRRGDAAGNRRDPAANYFDFHAVLRFVNQPLFNDPDYKVVVTVWQKKNPRRRWVINSETGPGQRTALSGRSLTMEKVDLIELPPKS